MGTSIFEVSSKYFSGKTVVSEDKCLLILANEFERDAARFVQITAADSQLGIDNGRVVKNEVAIAGGRAVIGDSFERLFSDSFGERLRIGNGSRAADELGA